MCFLRSTLRILTPHTETPDPDPPNDTPGALKQMVLTPRQTSHGALGYDPSATYLQPACLVKPRVILLKQLDWLVHPKSNTNMNAFKILPSKKHHKG